MTEVSDRSGDPTLDELIDMYLGDGYWCDVDQEGQEVGLPSRLDVLRDPDDAIGLCCEVAKHFVAYVGVDGVQAEELDGKAWQLYPELEGTSLLRKGAHTWAEVKTDSGTFAVDWTASQYGRPEFPAVVRRSSAS
jgi:hypothetical protein